MGLWQRLALSNIRCVDGGNLGRKSCSKCTALPSAVQGFERTGLGERIACALLTVCGSNSLGLAIGLAAAEVLVCPAMPSTTSRAAGIFMPVITSVSKAAGSYPGEQSQGCTLSNRLCTKCLPAEGWVIATS